MFPYTVRPTTSPSNAPTAVPIVSTKEPSTIDTFLGDALYVFIAGFDDISAAALNARTTFQSIMINITHEAIVPSASANNIDDDSFSVHFRNASDALSITFSLCASTQGISNSLQLVINHHEKDISFAMRSGLSDAFGSDEDSMTIIVSLHEFGSYFYDMWYFQ